jgi:hypothetical protein
MLTMLQAERQRRHRSPPSLRQQYQAFILQRIEAYKNSLGRGDLLGIGEEAVSELAATVEGQFLLTEVLMQDTVDRLIQRRLRLPSYRRWSTQFRALRAAQRELTHWGLDDHCPIARVLPRIEGGDSALVVGAGGEAFACLLAANDMDVTFVADELACVERVEQRLAGEALGSDFLALVADLSRWIPPFSRPHALVIVDVAVLDRLSQADRATVIRELQRCTSETGIHLLVPSPHALAPEAFLGAYPDWDREEGRQHRGRASSRRSNGLVLTRHPCSNDTLAIVSDSDNSRMARG